MATPAPSIHIEEPSNHPRRQWPVTVSVPFARGAVSNPRQVIVRDPRRGRRGQIAAQRRALSRWADGSIRWLLLDFPIDLSPRESVDLAVEISDEPVAVDAQDGLRIEWAGDALLIDTGAMQCRLSANAGGLLDELVAHGVRYSSRTGTVLIRMPDGRNLDMRNGEARIELEEPGPQRAVIAIRGRHVDGEGRHVLDYILRLTVYAWQPILHWRYTIVNAEDEETTPVASIQMIQPLDLVADDTWAYVGVDRERYTMPEGWVTMTTDKLETRASDGKRRSGNLSTIRQEVPMEPFIIVGDKERMVLMLPKWAHYLFPKAAHYYGHALRYDIWPEWGGTWDFKRGMAKTHELVIALAPPAADYDSTMPAVAPVLRPIVATVPSEYIESTTAVPGFFAARPGKYPAIETKIAQLYRRRARAYGMLHFGDAPAPSYTAQGRGRKSEKEEEALIWVNSEYDMPYMALTQFLRTGNRNTWFLDVGPTVWHMMDVDTLHYSPEHPVDEGGQVLHLTNHVEPSPHVDPSHEWTEGLVLYHLLTGDAHAREHAIALGDHLVRWTDMHRADLASDRTAARVSGWALIALVAVYELTGDIRYLQCAGIHADGLRERIEEGTGHLTEWVSYGYPYRAGFMTDVAAIGLKRLWDVTGDDRWRDLALRMLDDQIEHLMLPSGILVYKELPENREPYLGLTSLEAWTHAYRWTCDRKYLEHAARLFQVGGLVERELETIGVYLVESPEGALYEEIRLFNRDAHSFSWMRWMFPFLRLMHDLDLLKQIEPTPVDLSGIAMETREERAKG